MQQRTTLPIPTEAEEAQVLMDYMRLKQLLFTHVKNETGWSGSNKKVRNWSALLGAKDGVSPGFPDFLVVLPSQVIAISGYRYRIKASNRRQSKRRGTTSVD